jgi:hypothetical protein
MNSFRIRRALGNLFILLLIVFTQQRSEYSMTDPVERVRAYTRWLEFDYVSWTVNALSMKISVGSLAAPDYLDREAQRRLVFDHLDLLARLEEVDEEIEHIYADPNILHPEEAAADLLREQSALQERIDQQSPLVEAVIQQQISAVVGEMGLGLGGQPLPPLMYHVTPLPLALIVSPREVIRQDADISILPDLTLDEIVHLEEAVAAGLNVSTLVVPVGGIGVYPTMVSRTTNLNWLVETVAHEWIHNTLTLRPAGALYFSSPEMRTINETAANIAGKEIGAQVIDRFYPEFKPRPPRPIPYRELHPEAQPYEVPEPAFDYRAEMHETRITADALLAEGKIEEAEAYMEARRQFFWEHGYPIRKLNQAYFAFYGAYADQPGGAAGVDPIGAAVRRLRTQSSSLASFINRLAWVTSYESLLRMTGTD